MRCAVGIFAGLGLLAGCTSRVIEVTSEPAGALVWLNDVEVGRTPCEVQFKYYGVYDVRLRREGYEPVTTSRRAEAPPHEWVGLDLLASPLPITDRVAWHFVLTPVAESADRPAAERDLLERARQMRGQ
ncbi:MAG: PEGA domain-containing protein [Phycisphaeraceae bacterium]|nr:PEGA domain-containing protein [Phycisphaeraceae bacterium]